MSSTAHPARPHDPNWLVTDRPAAEHRLELQELIGSGGAAVVHRAYDPRLGRTVAVKQLPAAAALDIQSRERFLGEIRISAALDHPHIVPVFATGTTLDAPYLEMQAISGRSLDQVIADLQAIARAGQQLTGQTLLELAQPREMPQVTTAAANTPLPKVRATPCYYSQVARWLADVASALEHVHARGFLHGDVKPANLLVEPSGHIWLIDFGAACELTETGKAEQLIAAGTLPYLAPERLESDAAPDVRQDVYGLGATLYELLTLRRPVAGGTAQAMRHEIATRPPLPPRKCAPTTPRQLDSIAMRALARAPHHRFATMADLQAALDGYSQAADVADRRTRGLPQPRLRLTLVILLVVVIAAVLCRIWPREPSLAERSANLVAKLPPGLKAELPSDQSPRLLLTGCVQLTGQPFEIPLDLVLRDKVTWRIEPRPWLTHAGHSYTLAPHPSGWLAAEALAQAWGGHLVAINDQDEQDFLNRTFLAQDTNGKYPVLWIGLSAANSSSEYRWSSGEELTFRNWNPGEPSRGWDIEHYAVANWHVTTNIDNDGQVGDWNDVGEPGLRKTGGYQGIVELPHTQQSAPPIVSVCKRGGRRLAMLPPTGDQLPAAGRVVIEPTGDGRQLIDVTITVE